MKRLIVFLSVLVFALAFAGCSDNTASDGYIQGSEWMEVQEITYFLNANDGYGDYNGSTTDSNSSQYTFTTFFSFMLDETLIEITKEEYDKSYFHISDLPYKIPLSADKKNIEAYKKHLNEYVYSKGYENDEYFKQKIADLSVTYVKIKFLNDESLEINYDGDTIRVKPLSYQITYFTA